MKFKLLIAPILVLLLLLIGCNTQETEETSTVQTPQTNPMQKENTTYPIIKPEVEIQNGYPVDASEKENETSYPTMENLSNFPKGPEFNINEPLSEGDTQVTGTGPADVPINLVDVSEMGLFIAETIINKDGTFIFSFQDPLEAGHSIGIQLGDIEGTDIDPNDLLYNENYYERPLIGILFDMVVVN
jgi:hypothetical protein